MLMAAAVQKEALTVPGKEAAAMEVGVVFKYFNVIAILII